jgi:adenylate kinase family enzyme
MRGLFAFTETIHTFPTVNKRIVILGTSGSGKTTLARKLAALHGIKHIELDVLYWKPGWTQTPMPEFLSKIEQAISENDNWVICGNYNVAKKLTLPKATDIIWLNTPLYLNLWRVFSRSVVRIIKKEDPFEGCKETWTHLIFNKDSLLLWVWNTHGERQKNFKQLLTKENFPNAGIRIVESKRDYESLLSTG